MVEGKWRIRYSDELYTLYDGMAFSTLIRIKRFQWADHEIIMGKERVPRRALQGHYGDRRLVGEPRNRWEYMVPWYRKMQ